MCWQKGNPAVVVGHKTLGSPAVANGVRKSADNTHGVCCYVKGGSEFGQVAGTSRPLVVHMCEVTCS